jgi:hypothetical protein
MVYNIVFGDILPLSVGKPVRATGVLGDERGKIIDFALEVPVVLGVVPERGVLGLFLLEPDLGGAVNATGWKGLFVWGY